MRNYDWVVIGLLNGTAVSCNGPFPDATLAERYRSAAAKALPSQTFVKLELFSDAEGLYELLHLVLTSETS